METPVVTQTVVPEKKQLFNKSKPVPKGTPDPKLIKMNCKKCDRVLLMRTSAEPGKTQPAVKAKCPICQGKCDEGVKERKHINWKQKTEKTEAA